MHDFLAQLTTKVRGLMTTAGIIFLFGKICLVAAAWFGGSLGAAAFESQQEQLIPTVPKDSTVQEQQKEKVSLNVYTSTIVTRNIFGHTGNTNTTAVTVAPTALKLRLVATHVTGSKSFAIIEETTKKEQDVFDLNSKVFEQATLLEILEDSVRLQHGSSIETLVMEEATGEDSGGSGEEIAANDDETEFTVPEEELSEALANLPRLLSQARAVPFFRNGASIGMRLFAIRRGSLYEKLGLKNGDILLSVNDNSMSDPSQALKLFEQLKTERSIAVLVERKGEQVDLKYSIR